MQSCTNWTNTVKRAAAAFYGTWLFQRLSSRTTPRGSQSQRWTLGEGMTRRSKFALYGFYFIAECVYTAFQVKVFIRTFSSLHGIHAVVFPSFLRLDCSSWYVTECDHRAQIKRPDNAPPSVSLSLSLSREQHISSIHKKKKQATIDPLSQTIIHVSTAITKIHNVKCTKHAHCRVYSI